MLTGMSLRRTGGEDVEKDRTRFRGLQCARETDGRSADDHTRGERGTKDQSGNGVFLKL